MIPYDDVAEVTGLAAELAAAEEQDALAADLMTGLAVMLDLPPIDDTNDPLESLAPEWRKLAGHVLASFAPDDLPRMFRPFAPTAVRLLALKLANDPEGSRLSVLELIDVAVCDLGIGRHELGCWDAMGTALDASDPPDTRARRA